MASDETEFDPAANSSQQLYPLCHLTLNACDVGMHITVIANVLSALILVANFINIIIIAQSTELRMTVQGTCMLHASISDFVIGINSTASSNCRVVNFLLSDRLACRIFAAQFMICAGTSLELITVLTYDRYLAIVTPFKYLGMFECSC